MWGYKEYLSEKIHFRPVWGNIFLKSNSSIYYSISKGGREGFVRSWSYFGEGNGNPLQYSCLENPMDGEAWKAAVHGVAEGRARLSDCSFTFHFHALEKEMATHSGVLAWRTPGMGEPGGLPSMGSHRVGHNWSDLAAADKILIRIQRTWTTPSKIDFMDIVRILYLTDITCSF